MRHCGAVFLIALGFCGSGHYGSGHAQPAGSVAAKVTPAEVAPALAAMRPHAIRAHMEFLADDLLEGRRTGTRGHDLAAKYVAAQFAALGLEPAGTGGGYFQPVPLVQITSDEPACSLAFLRDGRTIELTYGADYFTGTGDAAVTAPVVFVGFGVTAPELGHDDYAGIDVRGKLVARLFGTPASFPHDQRAFYSDPWVGARNAFAHGAAGLLTIFTPELERKFPWEFVSQQARRPALSWLDAAGRPHRTGPGGAILSRKAAEALFVGAPHSLAEVFANAEAGRVQSFELPVQASLRSTNRRERTESPNVVAVLRGSDPRLREEYVVLSAHLDHLGMAGPAGGDSINDSTNDSISDSINNGAYDNASGVAILLEVAHAFARLPVAPRRSVLFLAATGEEQGLNGSGFFAHDPPGRIVADVNLDMFLMLYPLRDIVAFGAEHSSLGLTVEEAARELGIAVSPDPFPEEVMFIRSDHYSFVQEGIPAIHLTGGFATGDPAVDGRALWDTWMRQVMHRPGDDMSQKIDFGAGVQFAKLNFLISYLVAQKEQAPSWNPGDFFGEKFGRSSGDQSPAGSSREIPSPRIYR